MRNDRAEPQRHSEARALSGEAAGPGWDCTPRERGTLLTPPLLPSSGRVRVGWEERAADGQTGLRVGCGETGDMHLH